MDYIRSAMSDSNIFDITNSDTTIFEEWASLASDTDIVAQEVLDALSDVEIDRLLLSEEHQISVEGRIATTEDVSHPTETKDFSDWETVEPQRAPLYAPRDPLYAMLVETTPPPAGRPQPIITATPSEEGFSTDYIIRNLDGSTSYFTIHHNPETNSCGPVPDYLVKRASGKAPQRFTVNNILEEYHTREDGSKGEIKKRLYLGPEFALGLGCTIEEIENVPDLKTPPTSCSLFRFIEQGFLLQEAPTQGSPSIDSIVSAAMWRPSIFGDFIVDRSKMIQDRGIHHSYNEFVSDNANAQTGLLYLLTFSEIPPGIRMELDRIGMTEKSLLTMRYDNGEIMTVKEWLTQHLPVECWFKKAREQLKVGTNTFVHCQEGMSRSAGLIIADLIYRGFSCEEAISHVRRGRTHVLLRSSLHEILKEYARKLGRKEESSFVVADLLDAESQPNGIPHWSLTTGEVITNTTSIFNTSQTGESIIPSLKFDRRITLDMLHMEKERLKEQYIDLIKAGKTSDAPEIAHLFHALSNIIYGFRAILGFRCTRVDSHLPELSARDSKPETPDFLM